MRKKSRTRASRTDLHPHNLPVSRRLRHIPPDRRGIAAHNPHWILGAIAFPTTAISLAVMTLLGNKQG